VFCFGEEIKSRDHKAEETILSTRPVKTLSVSWKLMTEERKTEIISAEILHDQCKRNFFFDNKKLRLKLFSSAKNDSVSGVNYNNVANLKCQETAMVRARSSDNVFNNGDHRLPYNDKKYITPAHVSLQVIEHQSYSSVQNSFKYQSTVLLEINLKHK
jgi:hypothetical protein